MTNPLATTPATACIPFLQSGFTPESSVSFNIFANTASHSAAIRYITNAPFRLRHASTLWPGRNIAASDAVHTPPTTNSDTKIIPNCATQLLGPNRAKGT